MINHFDGPITRSYLEGHRDLVTRLITGIIRVSTWVIEVINPLTSPLDPPS